jgi:superfamily II DNA or RNA helicase
MNLAEAAEQARRATEAILAGLARAERGIVVDSPPGAGKSTLVVRAAAELAEAGERAMVVGQTNEQVDDLIDRLAAEHPDLLVGRLSAHGYAPAARIARYPILGLATLHVDS